MSLFFALLTAALLVSVPLRAHAFSEGFKQFMTQLQSRVMLKGNRMGPDEAKRVWEKFDDEVISLLGQTQSEAALNKEGTRAVLQVTERNKEEVEDIELGAIEAKFYKLKGSPSAAWLVSLTNDMGSLVLSTFHIYRGEGSAFRKTVVFEEQKGPWERDQLLKSLIQVQKISESAAGSRFATYHLPSLPGSQKSKNNRSQIVWEYDGSHLKAVLWIPEVDWHTVDGQPVQGRGEVFPIDQ